MPDRPSSTTLQPSGAGLPPLEREFVHWYLKLLFAITNQAQAMHRFTREAERILQLVEGISSERCATPVLIDRVLGIEDSSRCWSIYMVLDHLRIVNEKITGLLEWLQSGHVPTTSERIQDLKPDPTIKAEAVARFRSCVSAYERAVNRLGPLGHGPRYRHPWFGPLSAHEWHCFIGIHQWVHRRQIERIVAHLP